jgi:hypothetical protein
VNGDVKALGEHMLIGGAGVALAAVVPDVDRQQAAGRVTSERRPAA